MASAKHRIYAEHPAPVRPHRVYPDVPRRFRPEFAAIGRDGRLVETPPRGAVLDHDGRAVERAAQHPPPPQPLPQPVGAAGSPIGRRTIARTGHSRRQQRMGDPRHDQAHEDRNEPQAEYLMGDKHREEARADPASRRGKGLAPVAPALCLGPVDPDVLRRLAAELFAVERQCGGILFLVARHLARPGAGLVMKRRAEQRPAEPLDIIMAVGHMRVPDLVDHLRRRGLPVGDPREVDEAQIFPDGLFRIAGLPPLLALEPRLDRRLERGETSEEPPPRLGRKPMRLDPPPQRLVAHRLPLLPAFAIRETSY